MDQQKIGMIGLALEVVVFGVWAVASWRVFKKAGQAGWKSLVPIYNFFIMAKMAKKKPLFAAGLFVPVWNVYVVYKVFEGIAKQFGKGAGTALGLLVAPFIFMPILAFGKAEFQRTIVPPPFRHSLVKAA